MTKTSLQLAVAASSHTGRVRKTNQDAYGYSAAGRCFVVCDGMGGAAGGEVASGVTVEVFLERLGFPPEDGGAAMDKRLAAAVQTANRILHTRAGREPALHGMGTTLVALVLGEERRGWVAHVGDSRCYLLRAAVLTRCTADHSLVGEQVRLGQMTAEEALVSPMRNVITRAVGVGKSVEVEVQEQPFEPGDVFLLCSDGLTRDLAESRVREILLQVAEAGGELSPVCEALIEAANAAGGGDNITCLLVSVGV